MALSGRSAGGVVAPTSGGCVAVTVRVAERAGSPDSGNSPAPLRALMSARSMSSWADDQRAAVHKVPPDVARDCEGRADQPVITGGGRLPTPMRELPGGGGRQGLSTPPRPSGRYSVGYVLTCRGLLWCLGGSPTALLQLNRDS